MSDVGRVRAILVDDHRCLTHTGRGLAYRVGRFLADRGIPADPELLPRELHAACARHIEFPLGRIATADDERVAWTAMWTDFLGTLAIPFDDALLAEMHRTCHYRAAKRGYPDALPALDALRPHFRLCLATNALPMVREALDGLGLWQAFDHTFVSALIGAEKPDERFFRAALTELRLPPEHVLLVDDLPENVQGARDLGLHGVLIDRSASANETPPGVVRSLTDLVDLLRQA
ncbi:HAD family hydrolase [Plantactinospora endophytica]|uniref:Hydrolase n=1 Tax=Plantactinospora endophytica TaxID=673535 RepID=A0ABQ4DV10_9ACTN|nr:HAD-IA family hydrolase [Plantactinospora endophytica]GIG86275.1 hypothetical protein Pen02_12110 [Plantactinospora endophytica]